MLRLTVALIFVSFALTAQVRAEQNPVVVELFTSQGCSSCPPADALLRELAGRDDVLALALHVDYWDYIGWKDEFALSAHTKRQKAYASEGGRRMIYTPQMIINGQDSIVGAKAMKIFDAIAAHRAQAAVAEITARRKGAAIRVELAPVEGAARPGDYAVILVRFTPERDVYIKRGENAGRHISYTNIVSDWTKLRSWDGKSPLALEADIAGDLAAAVIVQQSGPGPIVAAAKVQ
jgi:hypothetical protein